MKTVSKFNLASLLLAGAISLGGIGIAKLITNNAKSASADVTSAYAEEEPTIIGIGEENKATLTLEYNTPVTLTVKDGVTGQYNLALKIADRDPDTYYDFSAYIPVEGEEYPEYVYFAYNTYADAYIATFNVTAGTQLILTSYNEAAVTADVYFTDLFMGASTENGVYGLLINKDLSKTVQVENIAPDTYIARLQYYLEEGKLDEGATFSIKPSDGNEITLAYDANMYGYVADFTVTAQTTSITVSTTNKATVSVDVELLEKVTVNTALPEDEEHEATFTQYVPQNFYFDVKTSGFYAISAVTTTTNAEFAFELKANPNYAFGVTVNEKTYPMYLVGGQRYYFTITYNGLHEIYENVPTTAKAYFTVGAWTATPITLNSSVYVPVTLDSAKTPIYVPLNGVAGNTYDMNLFGVPDDVKNVYMYYGDTKVTFNADNGFMAEFTLESDSLNVYFTTDYDTPFTAMVQFAYAPYDYKDTITLGTAHAIDLRAKEDRVYFINDLHAGTYQITLSENNDNISVEDVYGNVIVGQGNTTGYFVFTPFDEEAETGTQYLLFRNAGDSNYSFNATVTAVEVEGAIELGETMQITLGAKETQNYSMALDAGYYTITLAYPDGSQIEVYFDGGLNVEAGVTGGLLITEVSGTHILTFTNLAEAQVTFTVTVVAFG